ncbi:MAG: T9SS C-terminal target domain-containing protein, partial [Calditrichaeota bacterium]
TGTVNPVDVTLTIGDDAGTTSTTAEIEVEDELDKTMAGVAKAAGLPEGYALFQNYPNPFNPETEIRFQLPEARHVVVRIYNTLGQEIRSLVDRDYAAGPHTVNWDGKDNHGQPVSSGVYLYQLHAGEFASVRKMLLVR